MPKRLVGGEYLLDLTPIEIEESVDVETYTNITNADVIEQLTNLKKYVPNPNGIKPVWIKMKNGETDELIVTRGEFKVVDDGEFEIVVHLDGYKLLIHIEFTQVLNDDNEPLDDWYIDTNDAKYLFTSNAQNIGAISELPVFENIVDAQGNKRFIDGDINLYSAVPEGITKLYGKYSLSGTHLLIVLAFSVANETQFAGTIAQIDLPKWIKDKLIAIFSNAVDFKAVTLFSDNLSSQSIGVYLRKVNENVVDIYVNTFTAVADRVGRIAFDLLIDNVAPESQGE